MMPQLRSAFKPSPPQGPRKLKVRMTKALAAKAVGKLGPRESAPRKPLYPGNYHDLDRPKAQRRVLDDDFPAKDDGNRRPRKPRVPDVHVAAQKPDKPEYESDDELPLDVSIEETEAAPRFVSSSLPLPTVAKRLANGTNPGPQKPKGARPKVDMSKLVPGKDDDLIRDMMEANNDDNAQDVVTAKPPNHPNGPRKLKVRMTKAFAAKADGKLGARPSLPRKPLYPGNFHDLDRPKAQRRVLDDNFPAEDDGNESMDENAAAPLALKPRPPCAPRPKTNYVARTRRVKLPESIASSVTEEEPKKLSWKEWSAAKSEESRLRWEKRETTGWRKELKDMMDNIRAERALPTGGSKGP